MRVQAISHTYDILDEIKLPHYKNLESLRNTISTEKLNGKLGECWIDTLITSMHLEYRNYPNELDQICVLLRFAIKYKKTKIIYHNI